MQLTETDKALFVTQGIEVLYLFAGLALAQALHILLWRLFKHASRLFPPNLHPFLVNHLKQSTRLFFLLVGLKAALLWVNLELHHVHLLLHIFIIMSLGWVTISVANAISDWLQQKFAWKDSEDNLRNRRISTQLGIFKKITLLVIMTLTMLSIVITIPSLRNLGLSLFASAGVAGLIIGMAAKSTLANLLAGVQMAITQPIRLDDAVIVEGEYGNIEEIGSSFVIVKLWDWRRLLVPLSYFIEKPFQNWTYNSTDMLGTVFFYVDYNAPVELLRAEMERITEASVLWDHKVRVLQVTDCRDAVMEIRVLASATTPGRTFDLRCEIREKMLAYMHTLHPTPLPRQRSEYIDAGDAGAKPT